MQPQFFRHILQSVKRNNYLRRLNIALKNNKLFSSTAAVLGGITLCGLALLFSTAGNQSSYNTAGSNTVSELPRASSATQSDPLEKKLPDQPADNQSSSTDGLDENMSVKVNNGQAEAKINGETMQLQGSGEIHRTFKTSGGTAQVDISLNTGTDGNSNTQTTVRSHNYGSSSSSVNISSETEVINE